MTRKVFGTVAACAMALGAPARADVDVYFWDDGQDLYMHVDVANLSTHTSDQLITYRTRFRSLFSGSVVDFAIDDMPTASGPYTQLTNGTAQSGVSLTGSILAGNVKINVTGDDPDAIDDGYDSVGGFWFRNNGNVVMGVPGDRRTTGVSEYSFTNRVLGYTMATAGLIDGGSASWTDGRLGAVSISVGSPPPSSGGTITITFTDDGTSTTASYSGSLNTDEFGPPESWSAFQPTPYIGPSGPWGGSIFGHGSGVTRWSNITFTRTFGGAGIEGHGYGDGSNNASGAPLTYAGDGFLFGTSLNRLEMPGNYVSGTPISGYVRHPSLTVADFGIVDTEFTLNGGTQKIIIRNGNVDPNGGADTFGDFSSPTAFADGFNYVNLWRDSTDTFSTSEGNAILNSGAGTAGYVWNQGDVLDGVGDKIQGTFSVSAFNRASSAYADIAAGFGLWGDVDGSVFLSEASVLLNATGNARLQGGGTLPSVGTSPYPSSFTLALEVLEVDCTSGLMRVGLSITGDYGATSKEYWVPAAKAYFGLTAFNTLDDVSLTELSFVDVSSASCSESGVSTIMIGTDTATQSGTVTLPITLNGTGSEFAFSGSIHFDPAVFTNPQLTVGAGAPSETSLQLNLEEAATGSVGFVLMSQDFAVTFSSGHSVILDLELTVSAQAPKTLHAVTFADDPAAREVVDYLGETIAATWVDGVVAVINRPPVAYDDAGSTDEDNVVNVSAPGVLGNDVELDFGDTLTVNPTVSATTPGGASISINSDGSFTYDPTGSSFLNALAVGDSYADAIDYTIADGDGGFDTATLTITVAGVNDAPTAGDDAGGTTAENVILNLSGAGLLGNDSDPDTGDTFSIISVTNSEKGAIVTLNGDGSIDYDPTEAPDLLALKDGVEAGDTFTYTIEDTQGGTGTATVSVTVQGREFEGDVTPSPHGDNIVDVSDGIRTANFQLGLDSPDPNEFARADTAPYVEGGDGVISLGDVVRTYRYAAGEDPIRRVLGPTEPTVLPLLSAEDDAQGAAQIVAGPGKARLAIIPTLEPDGSVGLSIDMNSIGQVAGVGFSIAFDPAIHRYEEHAVNNATGGGLISFVNTRLAGEGRLGVVIAKSDPRQTFYGGNVRLMTLKLSTIAQGNLAGSYIQFEDFPAHKAVSDSRANKVDTEYLNASLAALGTPRIVPAAWLGSYFDPADLNDAGKEESVWGAHADPDGDGQSNYAEYVAGTSPSDRNSKFVTLIEEGDETVAVSFYPFNEGRNYELLYKENLEDVGEWTPIRAEVGSLSWEPVHKSVSQEEGRRMSVNPNGKTGFYRVRISLPSP